MKNLRTRIAALLVFLCLGGSAFSASNFDYVQPFSLKPLNEGLELGIGGALTGSAILCGKVFDIKKNDFNASDLDKSSISGLEQAFMRPYSKPLHLAGTGTVGLAMATPLVFAVLPSSEWLTIGTMYAETMLFAYGIKEWTKLLVYRTRPYMYFDDYPQSKVDDGDWNCSFPSGHTTLAFAGAAFTTMVFCQCFPDSNWKYAVAGGAFGLAALTGGLRMASGNHFLTDVLVGAVIGTACGFVVPYMHTKGFYNRFEKKSGPKANVSPSGLSFSYNF